MKSHVRTMICSAMKWSGLLALAERRMRGSLTVLAYHRVLPDAQCRVYPLPALVTPARAFREQMRWLAANCEVLPLSQALERFRERSGSGRPIVAVTFDDGYADNYEAARVLEECGVRGTFFVTTSFLDGRPLWFDRAAQAWRSAPCAARAAVRLRLGLEDEAEPRAFVNRLKGVDAATREAVIAEVEAGCGCDVRGRMNGCAKPQAAMSRDEVTDLHRRGHEIGSHTVTHPILPQLSDDELRNELVDSRHVLEDLLGAEVRSISYPNGDHDERVVGAAMAAGYSIAATTASGFNDRQCDPIRLRRIDPTMPEAKTATHFRAAVVSRGLLRRRQPLGPRGIAYFNSHYPSISHTFIEREVAALRRKGARVLTFSVRPALGADCIGEAHSLAANETVALLDHPWRLARTAAAQVLRHPLRALRVFALAQRLAPPGLHLRLRHIAYAIEAARLARELRRAEVEHMHVHMANNGAMVALLACEHDPSLRYSLTIHGSAEFFAVAQNVLGPKAERAKFVRCISNFCRAQVMAWTKTQAWERCHVVRCGIDPGDEPKPRLDTSEKFRMITVGRLHPVKGYPLLLRACRSLDDYGIDWSLDMIGDGPARESLERLSAELGIADRVRFHGSVAAENVNTHYENADLMVMSSFMEGVPIVLMEAMARGLAVVATRVAGIPELVEDGVSGLLIAPGSQEQLAAAIRELADNHERRLRMGRAGRQRVVAVYNQERLGEEMHDLFVRYGVIGEPRARSDAKAQSEGVQSHHLPAPLVPRKRPRYVVISPCRNEAAYMRQTLDSMLSQSVRPDLWVIVDDGSTDDSPDILDEYVQKHEFIRIVRVEDRGRRSVGPGVVDAVNAGLAAVALDEFDYVCKLDLDLRLPPRYFELLIKRMEADAHLGTCSGKPYFINGVGRLVSEMIGDDVSAGMTKFYRVQCFKDIGGFVREVMWDGIDCHRCRMNGWRVRSWDDPELRFVHLRPMGSSQKSIWSGRFRHGYGQWFMGTSLPYMTASALFRMTRPPFFLGGLAMLCGYMTCMMRRVPQYSDAEFRQFLRHFQRLALLHGKSRAVELVESKLPDTPHRAAE